MSEEGSKISNVQRPISPHLQVYRPQISSVLSITHRATGFALFIGILLFAWWIIFNVYDCGDCINSLVTSKIGKIFIFLWSIALYYHFFNGVRHLFWDIGKGFDKQVANNTGLLVLILTAGTTAISWFYLLG